MPESIITVNLDAKCKRCGKGGATQNGLCMPCIIKGLKKGDYEHILKPLRDKTIKEIKSARILPELSPKGNEEDDGRVGCEVL